MSDKIHVFRIMLAAAIAMLPAIVSSAADAANADYVIEISVDGLGSSYLLSLFDNNDVPNFKRLKNEGTSTLNARNDYDITVTLPNHVTIVTAREIMGDSGHNWINNSDPAPGQTIHSNKCSYVASVFDVVHDNGLRTAIYTTKTKFSLFETSYNNADNGASDIILPDNGCNKIDSYYYDNNSSVMTDRFISAMKSDPFNYSLVHYTDGDSAGHGKGWGSIEYMNAIKAVDGYLGKILQLIDSSPALRGHTTIILTADHGGHDLKHSTATDSLNYTIPFFVWGVGATAGTDLYALNKGRRLDPGDGRPAYSAIPQPVRNGDGANLALKLLGFSAIPSSTINREQNLVVPEPGTALLFIIGCVILRNQRNQRKNGKMDNG